MSLEATEGKPIHDQVQIDVGTLADTIKNSDLEEGKIINRHNDKELYELVDKISLMLQGEGVSEYDIPGVGSVKVKFSNVPGDKRPESVGHAAEDHVITLEGGGIVRIKMNHGISETMFVLEKK
jgi:hypothetical protein